jgi:branched-chain amino acid transport system permease protein
VPGINLGSSPALVRATLRRVRRPRPAAAPGTRAGAWIVLVIGLAFPLIEPRGFYLQQFQIVGTYALAAIGLNLNLFAGELFIGQSAIFGAGAYAAAIALTHQPNLDAVLVCLLGIGAGAAVGLVAGIAGLRVGRWYFAMLSFLIIGVEQDLIGQFPSVTGGLFGLTGLPHPVVAGQTIDQPVVLYYIVFACLLGSVLMMRNLLRSSWGPALATLRRSDVAAESLGVQRYRAKLTVYLLSALPCGLAGALFVYSSGLVLPSVFSAALTVLFLASVVLGGERTLIGPVVGIVLLQLIPIYLVSFEAYQLIIYGAFLLVVTILMPGGMVGELRRAALRVRSVVQRRTSRAPAGHGSGRPVAAPGDEGLTSDRPVTGVTEPMPLVHRRALPLEVDAVSKHFAGLAALDGVSLRVEPGTIVGLIGANGSGKTTLLNIISGFYQANAGEVRLGTRRLTGASPSTVARHGIGRTYQTPLLPEEITVLATVVAGFHQARRATALEHMLGLPRARGEWRRTETVAAQHLARVGIPDSATRIATELPLGHRRLLEVARALALEPTLLLLDEPASGLSERDIDILRQVLRALRDSGVGLLLVEHNVPFVMSVADRIEVLDHGRLLASGRPTDILDNPAVVSAYLGHGQVAAPSVP